MIKHKKVYEVTVKDTLNRFIDVDSIEWFSKIPILSECVVSTSEGNGRHTLEEETPSPLRKTSILPRWIYCRIIQHFTKRKQIDIMVDINGNIMNI